MTLELFPQTPPQAPPQPAIPSGVLLLPGFATIHAFELVAAIANVTAQAAYRHMITPGGFRMSVAMTNCGTAGWVTDRKGYRYDAVDPETGRPWPEMPEVFRRLALAAAAGAGFHAFAPDACLINRYEPGARMSLHQDRNERDFTLPIVSVSLGLPATFLLGGDQRTDKPMRIALAHGDVIVWGGPARLRFHGILPLKPGSHPLLGNQRINLTLRQAS